MLFGHAVVQGHGGRESSELRVEGHEVVAYELVGGESGDDEEGMELVCIGERLCEGEGFDEWGEERCVGEDVESESPESFSEVTV